MDDKLIFARALPAPVDVAVDSLDRAAAESLGADGFAFGVSLAKPIDGNALVEVTVDEYGLVVAETGGFIRR